MIEDDATLGGYLRKHDRPPAFEGSDGSAYTVETYVDDDPCEDGRYGAAVLFVRWSADGDAAEGHLESDYIEYGATTEDARNAIRRLTLHQLKAQLEHLIESRKEAPGW